MKPPINRMAEAFKPTFGRLYGPFDASGATDHDTLLQAPELMTIGAEQVFEKAAFVNLITQESDPMSHRVRHDERRIDEAFFFI